MLLVVHGFPPAGGGGTELYAEALARALRDAGDEVFVLTRHADSRQPEYQVLRTQRDGFEIASVNHTFHDARGFADTYRNPAIRRLAGSYVDAVRPDVAHLHHLTCLSADLPEELAQRGIPTVLTLHDYWLICHRGQLLDRRLRRCDGPGELGCADCCGLEAGSGARSAFAHALRRWLRPFPSLSRTLQEKAAGLADAADGAAAASRSATVARASFMRRQLRFPDALLAPSRTLRDRFVDFGVDPARLSLQELGIPLAPFHGLERVAAPRLRIGYLGGLMVSKAPHVLLEAFARLSADEASVRLLGGCSAYHGDDSYRARLEPLLRLPGVTHDGQLPHAAVPAALATMDVVAVPSIWLENSPLVIREAFAAGAPVLASDVGGMAEMVTDERNGLLFRAGDAGDLHRCLRRLLDEPELLPRLRADLPPVRDIAEDAAWTRRLYADLRRRSAARQPSRAPRPRLAAVVLHHRTPDDTLLAVRSLAASRRPVDDLLVVDNGSADGSNAILRAWLPEATVIETGRNLGFSAGCNVGIAEALRRGAGLVLLLNSDALLPPDALAILEEALADPGVGIAGPLVLSRSQPDRVASAGLAFSLRSGRLRHRLAGAAVEAAPDGAYRPDAVAGCAMLVKREVFERVGLLAEEYFFSCEDLDLCLRARQEGLDTACVPSARAYHQGGVTLGAGAPSRHYYGARNQLLLADRFGHPRGRLAAAARSTIVIALNLAHALLRSPVPRRAGTAAVLRGAADHRRRRYGPAGAATGAAPGREQDA